MGDSLKVKRSFFTPSPVNRDWWPLSLLKWLLLIFLALTFQTKILIFGFPQNFTILVVYYFIVQALNKQRKTGKIDSFRLETKCIIFSAFVGFINDLISNSLLGPSFLSKTLLGFTGAILFGSVFFRWTVFLGIIVVSLFTLLDGIFQVFLRVIISDIKINIGNLISMILVQSFINLPFGIILKPKDIS